MVLLHGAPFASAAWLVKRKFVADCRARCESFDERPAGFDKGRGRVRLAADMRRVTTPAVQRVRIGLTGLAFVFICVMLAMALTREPAGEEPITPNLLDQQQAGRAAAPATPAETENPTEPLAELGVAPGKAEANSAQPEAPPPGAALPQN
jgi:hypothetical protein